MANSHTPKQMTVNEDQSLTNNNVDELLRSVMLSIYRPGVMNIAFHIVAIDCG
jgi:hypothetical protein